MSNNQFLIKEKYSKNAKKRGSEIINWKVMSSRILKYVLRKKAQKGDEMKLKTWNFDNKNKNLTLIGNLWKLSLSVDAYF